MKKTRSPRRRGRRSRRGRTCVGSRAPPSASTTTPVRASPAARRPRRLSHAREKRGRRAKMHIPLHGRHGTCRRLPSAPAPRPPPPPHSFRSPLPPVLPLPSSAGLDSVEIVRKRAEFADPPTTDLGEDADVPSQAGMDPTPGNPFRWGNPYRCRRTCMCVRGKKHPGLCRLASPSARPVERILARWDGCTTRSLHMQPVSH